MASAPSTPMAGPPGEVHEGLETPPPLPTSSGSTTPEPTTTAGRLAHWLGLHAIRNFLRHAKIQPALLLLLLFLVVTSTLNKVMYTAMLFPLAHFELLPISISILLYLPLFGLSLAITTYRNSHRHASHNDAGGPGDSNGHTESTPLLVNTSRQPQPAHDLDDELETPVPDAPLTPLRFALWVGLLGGLDTLSMIGHVIPGARLPGPICVLLAQASIPITLIISILLLHSHYKTQQYVASVVMLTGVLVAVLPSLHGDTSLVMWEAIYLVATIPSVVSHVLKENLMSVNPALNPFSIAFFSAVAQTLWLVPMLPAAFASEGHHPADLLANFRDGWACIRGHDRGPHAVGLCSEAPVYSGLFLSANMLLNIAFILVLRYAGASVAAISSTLVIPLSSVLFSVHWIMREHARALHWNDGVAMILIVFGMFLYKVNLHVRSRMAIVTGAIVARIALIAPPRRLIKPIPTRSTSTMSRTSRSATSA